MCYRKNHGTLSRSSRLRLLSRTVQIPLQRQPVPEARLHSGRCRSHSGHARMESVTDKEYQDWLADPVAQLEYQLWSILQDLQLLQKAINE